MGSFRKVPSRSQRNEDLDDFVSGAKRRRQDASSEDDDIPWASRDKDEKAEKGFLLKLNPHYHAKLKWLADADDRSMQYIAQKLIFDALDREASRVLDDS